MDKRVGVIGRILRRGSKLLVVLVMTLTFSVAAFIKTPKIVQAAPPAQGECAVGYYPVVKPIVQNSNFAIAPDTIAPFGDPGNNPTTVPGYYYANAHFYSQTANAGTDVYPDQAGDTRNAFSIQDGFYTNNNELNQLPFPGDRTYNVPASNTWFYSNGNIRNGGEYLVWEQDVTGLVALKQYVFVTYISNVVEPPYDAMADPIVRLRTGGTSGLPDGNEVIAPIALDEVSTRNSAPLNGWRRIAYPFIANGPDMKLKITSSAINIYGDDYSMTAVMIQECIPVPSITCSASAAAAFVGSPVPVTISVSNASPVDDATINISMIADGVSYSNNNLSLPKSSVNKQYPLGPIGPLAAGPHTYTVNVSGNANGYPVSTTCLLSLTVNGRPFFKVFGGDVSVGGCFLTTAADTSCAPVGNAGKGRIYAYTTFNQFLGSSAQYAVQALSHIGDGGVAANGVIFNGFSSSAVNQASDPSGLALTFANVGNTHHAFGQGGDLAPGGTHPIPDFYDLTIKTSPPQLGGGTYNLSDLLASAGTSGQVEIGGDLILNDDMGDFTGKLAIYVAGDVYIRSSDGRLTIAPGPYAGLSNIPFLSLIAKGSIFIDRNITQLDGMYVAQPVTNAKGIIYTCADGLRSIPAAASMQTTCANRLNFNGLVVAKGIKLQRTGAANNPTPGETDVDPGTTEVFRALAEFYLANPPFKNSASNLWLFDSAAVLPPIL